jgi:integrase
MEYEWFSSFYLIRNEMQAKLPDNVFLFPALKDKDDGKLSTNSITEMVRSVGKAAHVDKLNLHKCRRTFGQMLLDEGVSIEVVSVLMEHTSTAMTEKFYCRRKQQQASVSVRNTWGKKYHTYSSAKTDARC